MNDAPSALERPPRVSGRTVAAICATEVAALGSLIVPLAIGLALAVSRLETGHRPETVLSLVVGCGAVTSLVAHPVVGWLSDRSRSPTRAWWILGGAAAGALIAPVALVVDSLAGLTIYWCAMQAAYSAVFATLYGTIADVVPEADRARVAGLFSGSAAGAIVLPLAVAGALPKVPVVMFVLMPTLALPVVALAFLHLRRHATRPVRRERDAGALRAASRQYWLVWLQRLLAQLAHSIVLLYGVYFLIRRVGLAEEAAASWVAQTVAVTAVATMVVAIAVGRLASRTGNYGPYIFASFVLLIAALAIKAAGTSVLAYVSATLLVGMGVGCYYAVDLALVLRTVPAQHAATLLGFFNIARTLPQSLAPAIGPVLLAVGSGDLVGVDRSQNYFALYVGGLVVTVVALLLVVPIRVLRREAVET